MKKFYILWMFVAFTLQLSAQEYCIPAYGSSSGWEYIRDFSTTGGDTNISNLASGSSSGTAYYGDFTGMSVTAGQGSSFDFSLTYQYAGSAGVGFKIWVDWNNDFTFSEEEEVTFFEFPAEDEDPSDGTSVVTISGSISIPSDTSEGNHRMRIRSFDGFISDLDACQNGFWGETEDYTVSVTASTSLGCVDGYILSESFEGMWPPEGWSINQTNTTESWEKLNLVPEFNFDGEYVANIEYDSNLELQDEWLITPTLDLTSSSNPRLEFLTRVSYYWGVLMDTYDLQIQISTDNGTTWDQIWDETDLGVPELDGWYEQHQTHQVYLDLTEYAGESVKIAFRYFGTDGAFAMVDAVKVICCPSPLNVTVTEINLTSATVSWESGVGQYEIEFGEAGFVQGEGTVLTANSNSTELEGLLPATSYDVYVRSICDSSSEWTPFTNFLTRFDAAELPYCYGFEYEDGWVTENNTIGQYPSEYPFMNGKWFISEGIVEPTEGTHTAAYAYSNFGQADSWYFSRGVNLTAGQQIAISFDYRVGSGQFPENLSVTIGTEPNSLMQGTTLWSEESMTNENYESAETTFTATEDGVYYIGFYASSDPMMTLIYLDNVCIEESDMSVNDASLSGISIYPNPVKDVLNINSVNDIDKVEVYSISGQKLYSQSFNTDERNIDMSSLSSGAYMVRVFLTTGAIETFKVLKK